MRRVCGFLVFLLWAATCSAGEPVLVIRHAAAAVEIPLATIKALPQTEYITILPGMDDQPHRVRGPLLKDVLALAGFSGKILFATAYDRYQAEIPVEDMENFPLLAAHEVDGKALTLRDKGPLWIVYPSDADPHLRLNPIYEARSVWQLKEISVR